MEKDGCGIALKIVKIIEDNPLNGEMDRVEWVHWRSRGTRTVECGRRYGENRNVGKLRWDAVESQVNYNEGEMKITLCVEYVIIGTDTSAHSQIGHITALGA